MDFSNIGIDDLVASLGVDEQISIDAPNQPKKTPYEVGTLMEQNTICLAWSP